MQFLKNSLSKGGSVLCHDIFNYYVIYLPPLVCDVEIVYVLGMYWLLYMY